MKPNADVSVRKSLLSPSVLTRALVFLVVTALYMGGVVTLDAYLDARLPLVLFAIFFLPAVIRSWLMFYWTVIRDPRVDLRDNERLI